MTDLCAPCDRYRRAEWGRNLHLESCCLNCASLNEQRPCPTLCERFYPSDREVIRSTRVPTRCAGTTAGAGGDS